MRAFGNVRDDGRSTVGDDDRADAWFRRAIAAPFAPSEAQLSRIEGPVLAAFRGGRRAHEAAGRIEPTRRRPHVAARTWLAVVAPVVLAIVLVAQAGTGHAGSGGPWQPGLHDAVDRTRLPSAHPTASPRDRDREPGGWVGVSSRHVLAPLTHDIPSLPIR